jgi:hypothetical protein
MQRQIYPLTAIRVSTLALKLNFQDGPNMQFECQSAIYLFSSKSRKIGICFGNPPIADFFLYKGL